MLSSTALLIQEINSVLIICRIIPLPCNAVDTKYQVQNIAVPCIGSRIHTGLCVKMMFCNSHVFKIVYITSGMHNSQVACHYVDYILYSGA
jgi:hypothetical protein